MKSRWVWLAAILAVTDIFLQFYLANKGIGIANWGISFGLGKNVDVWPLVILAVMFFLIKINKKNIGVPFMLFGGLGNFVVRLRLGYVWDYIPIFGLSINLSDLIINFGLITMIIQEWRK